MIYHYAKKGRFPSEIYNLPEGEKALLLAIMLKEMEEDKVCPFLGRR